MKKIFFLITILSLILFSSCFEDLYYYFTDEERTLLVYNTGETIKLLRKPQTDTLTFVFTEIIRDSLRNTGLGLQYHNYEIYDAVFEQNSCSFGRIFASKEPTFKMNVSLELDYKTEFEGSLCDTLYNYTLNSKEYSELFVFAKEKGQSPMLYFSKDEGIVYIDSTASGNSYALIEYIKGE
ncbi:MAG: hypothetical protein K9H26_19245 [Prolixibacteraceae bacterium]|nr:hypothetical protein [Prolixibacteraceae bacterium]